MRLAWLIFLPALAYQFLAIAAAVRHLLLRDRMNADFLPGISVLKPVRGLDPNTRDAFRSQISQDYPEWEVLFGVQSHDDACVAEIERLQKEFPQKPIRLIVGAPQTPNGKAGILMELSRHAKYPVRVVNDGDIGVTPDYLRTVVAPLRDDGVGVVTCLYRAKTHNLPAGWEALGIASDFMPSTLVAQLLGVRDFGLGSTLVFRAADLESAGGFESFAQYIADDYRLAHGIAKLGKRTILSGYVVETSLGEDSWGGVWLHQLRWARTIRSSKGAGYAGLFITHAGVWTVAACLGGWWDVAGALLIARLVSALVASALVLRSRGSARFFWLAPVWDIYAFCVWAACYAGREVRWRDRVMTLDSRGRISSSKSL